MVTQVVRVNERTREVIRDLAQQVGESMQVVIDEAIEDYRRKIFFEKANTAYAALRQDPEAWDAMIAERNEWDATLADGLDNNDVWIEPEAQ